MKGRQSLKRKQDLLRWMGMGLGLVMLGGILTGCGQKDPAETSASAGVEAVGQAETSVSAVTEAVSQAETTVLASGGAEKSTEAVPGGEPGQAVAVETDEAVEQTVVAKTYYLRTEAEAPVVPSLTLFDDGTFGFSYDVLSSYYPHGTYELTAERLTAVTDDQKYRYVFRVDGDQLVFIRDESSETTLISRDFGVPVEDGAVFGLEEPASKAQVQMTAVVKEVGEGSLLVSSRSDGYPGAFYVYFGELDVSGIQGGDEVIIYWDGTVMETDPAQIYAEAIERR